MNALFLPSIRMEKNGLYQVFNKNNMLIAQGFIKMINYMGNMKSLIRRKSLKDPSMDWAFGKTEKVD